MGLGGRSGDGVVVWRVCVSVRKVVLLRFFGAGYWRRVSYSCVSLLLIADGDQDHPLHLQ